MKNYFIIVGITAFTFFAYLHVGHASEILVSDGETAMQVQSWCKDIAAAKINQDGTFLLHRTADSGFCWGAFATIQILSKSPVSRNNPTPMLGLCPPAQSTRIQFIKIFSKYVDENPNLGHVDFAHIALAALTDAFPCSPETQSKTKNGEQK